MVRKVIMCRFQKQTLLVIYLTVFRVEACEAPGPTASQKCQNLL